ncbi:MAG: monooxygenase [Acidimicrobiales bacterium]|nr:MAG: monooxygenase [Acidimicrobiales bacterium]
MHGAEAMHRTEVGESRVDERRFREVLGHLPTGVTVVTGISDEGPSGLVVGSFSSVSLRPPLVAFFVDHGSKSWPLIRSRNSFAVNVLAADQKDLCTRFARSGEDKFAGVTWHPSPVSGSPLLGGVVAWIDCDIYDERAYGDHDIVVGLVRALDADGSDSPLVFFRGRLGTFAEEA